MSKIRMTGAELRELREKMLLRQRHMSDILGVHWTTLSDWERGKADVPHCAALVATLIADNPDLREKVVEMTVTP
jgi:DNA-binding transcriptional regulator YiaG